MATNASNAADTRPAASLYEGLVHVYRELFEPWLEHPRVLDAYVRARLRPGGERLDAEGLAVLTPRDCSVCSLTSTPPIATMY